ncbi:MULTISPECIES: 2,3-dihydroxyphenylpropionate 1,2-dioxygenase [Novosphingobium]|uniref:DODA-type extradiol aromatic ring-opening family dioxygenase n=1 Tax=Novosphingobium TaxID=165696 RepID=UPI0003B4A99E|nr:MULTISPECIES: 2,3-dihydroxyphenylpropionate 1,2-dioxygenase [Novosphingobium]WQD92434.1 2,3-dihydroxyphenylpropionate 1,2-dioxygenase [Novosphingobium capsulatum]
MAEITGVYAVSHTPVMTNMPDAPAPARREAAFRQFTRVGQEIAATQPDALVLVSDDHLHNFFLDNLPPFCIGVARSYPSPVEGWLKIPKQQLPGDAALAAHLLQSVMAAGFDPALSMELTLDHGMMTPLDLAGIAGAIPVVPILVNTVQPPMPAMRRCVAFGRALGQAIRGYMGAARVAVLATGGLSHDVGTPRMGQLDEAFDRGFLQQLEAGGLDAAADFAEATVNTAGNGAEEVRNWLVAQGIAEGAPFETYHYDCITDWYTGIGLGRWSMMA